MKKNKIITGYALYAVGIVFLFSLGAWFYFQIKKLDKAEDELAQVLSSVFKIKQLEQDFLNIELVNTNYYKTDRSILLELHKEAIEQSKSQIDHLIENHLYVADTLKQLFIELNATLDNYNQSFNKLIVLYKQKGFAEYGLEGLLKLYANPIEKSIDSPELLQRFYKLRYIEKEFRTKQDNKNYALFRVNFTSLLSFIEYNKKIDNQLKINLKNNLNQYYLTFEKLAYCLKQIGYDSFKGVRYELTYSISKMDEFISNALLINSSKANSARNKLEFILGIIIVFIVITTVLFLKFYLNEIKDTNVKLNAMVKERTLEIEQQKALAAELYERQTDSIEYAKTMQMQMLPSAEKISSFKLPLHVWYQPKDLVSGDFYWVGNYEDNWFVVVGDCTGHGVPGAFMTVLAMSTLDKIVSIFGYCASNDILKIFDFELNRVFSQKGETISRSDRSLDCAIIKFNFKKNTVEYAGARTDLYYLDQLNNLIILESDKYPIGETFLNNNKTFKNNFIDLNSISKFFIFSDGLSDQIARDKRNKKFGKQNIKELILSNANQSAETICKNINMKWIEWKSDSEQLDDVVLLVIENIAYDN